LHHILERENGFDILYSCKNITELERNVLSHQPDILLVNAMFTSGRLENCISNLRKHKKDIQLVFYGCSVYSSKEKKVIKAYGQNVFVCPDEWSSFINLL